MARITTHPEQVIALKRIEGQVRGIQKMIEDKRYCVDILMQLHSIIGALSGVEDRIFARHLEGCVVHALIGKTKSQKVKKIDEIMSLLKRFKRSG